MDKKLSYKACIFNTMHRNSDSAPPKVPEVGLPYTTGDAHELEYVHHASSCCCASNLQKLVHAALLGKLHGDQLTVIMILSGLNGRLASTCV